MRREFIFTLVLLLALMGCEKENTPPEQVDTNAKKDVSIEIVHGNNQSGNYNSPLQDSLVVKVSDSKGNPVSKAPVSFELTRNVKESSRPWGFSRGMNLTLF